MSQNMSQLREPVYWHQIVPSTYVTLYGCLCVDGCVRGILCASRVIVCVN